MLSTFVTGSAVSGAARSMNMLIAGRAIQGIGGGGIITMIEIVISDLVPLVDRGIFIGIIGGVYAIASAVGPPIGGALAGKDLWRWLFYVNIPLGAIALVFVSLFLNFRAPKTTFKEKMAQMDWIGNFIVVPSTTSCAVALTWAGVEHPWGSAQVLVPLIIGMIGLLVFFVYEAISAAYPIVPISLFKTITGLSGYLTSFIHGIVMIALIYYIPVFFQASRSATPIQSAILFFGSAFSIAPASIISGVTAKVYRPQNWIGWMIIMVGFGLVSTLKVDTPTYAVIGYQIILGAGLGTLATVTTLPILAAIDVRHNAQALAVFAFIRGFAQTWGITLGSIILQNGLSSRLPSEFTKALPSGIDIAYSAIPQIASLQQPLKREVEDAFAQSLRMIWLVMLGISGVGLLCALAMKALPMHTATDEPENWGFEEAKPQSGATYALAPLREPEEVAVTSP